MIGSIKDLFKIILKPILNLSEIEITSNGEVIEIKDQKSKIKINSETLRVLSENDKEVKVTFFCDGAVIEEDFKTKWIYAKDLQKTRKNILARKGWEEKEEKCNQIITGLPSVNVNKYYLTFDYYMGEREKEDFLDKVREKLSFGYFTSRQKVSAFFDGHEGFSIEKPKNGYSPVIYALRDKINSSEKKVEKLPSRRLNTLYVGHKHTGVDTLCIYDKYRESNNRFYKGCLRIELLIKGENISLVKEYKEGKKSKEELISFFIKSLSSMIEFRFVPRLCKLNNLYRNPRDDFWDNFLKNLTQDSFNSVDLDFICENLQKK